MALHGSVSPFDASTETWSLYVERLNQYFIANDVVDANKKRAIFLSACGPKTYKLVRSLVDDAPDSKSYDELVKLVKDFHDPKPSVIVQRYKFNSRVRAMDESIVTYIAALRQLAEHCDYKDTLQEMLRDRLVCGVNHAGIQKRLLAEKDLTFTKALDIAQALEAAEKGTKDLTIQDTTQNRGQGLNYTSQEHNQRSKFTPPHTRKPCHRCGGKHSPTICRFKDFDCHNCKRRGHISRMCRVKSKQDTKHKNSQRNHFVSSIAEEKVTQESSEDESYAMFTARSSSSNPLIIHVKLNNVLVPMELDTGASLTVINKSTYKKICAESVSPIKESKVKLKTYTGECIPILGTINVHVQYDTQEEGLSLLVVDGGGPNLMGRDWLGKLKVNLASIHSLAPQTTLNEVLDRHSPVFSEGLGCLKGVKVQLRVDDKAVPRFFKPRPVPFLLRKKVETELERLVTMGIILPIEFSKWAAPIVPVLKQDGSVRICGDFKVTINQVSQIDSYPLPRVEELFSRLSGGKYFSKLDLSQAYLQVQIDEDSRQYVTINTHKGLFRYNRLPFGVAAAPAIFQRCMESLLQSCQGVSVYLDDILVTGSTEADHLQNLDVVLSKLLAAGLRLKRSKCFFLKPSVEYLGHIIDERGLHPTTEKVKAIQEAPKPKNVAELRSFLGIINYYSRFLPNLAAQLTPLYDLLRKQSRWSWTTKQDTAFEIAKNALQKHSLLVHYDDSKPLVLTCDASPYGIGAILSHTMEDGTDRPVAYASRTLTVAEKKYSQLEKEGLAIVFGTKKFHNYLFGRHFTIESDHKPLSFLFSENKQIPQMASSRIQRWALTLSAYHYSIRYKSGKDLSNADALSRLPRPVTTTSDCLPGDLINLLTHLSTTTSLSAINIKELTDKDAVLSRVRRYIQSGWPVSIDEEEMRPFFSRRNELSVLHGCVLWGSRILVPKPCRSDVLKELHQAHPGSNKMKALARSYVWWPKMDSEIEAMVKDCTVCQGSQPLPSVAPLHPWEWPTQPWSRLHLDFAGPFMGHMFLILVDAHSKWIEAHIMQSITSAKTIEKLRIIFSTHGLPRKVVTDNGPSFISQEFKEFMEANGIKHVTTPPYHPSSNGLVERAVQTVKRGLKCTEGKTIQDKLSKFLFKYRIMPHTTTGVSPAELLINRRPRCCLDFLFPDVSGRVERSQRKQKENHDNSKTLRMFAQGDKILAKNFRSSNPKWLRGEIIRSTGPLSYLIKLSNGIETYRHVDHIRKTKSLSSLPNNVDQHQDEHVEPEVYDSVPFSIVESSATPSEPTPHHGEHSTGSNSEGLLRRSTRIRNPPDRFNHPIIY